MNKLKDIILIGFLTGLMVWFLSCDGESIRKVDLEGKNLNDNTETVEYETKADDTIQIYYDLPGPVEMSKLLKGSDAVFYAALLNKPANSSKYINQADVALNTGIYGVDLVYSKLFGQVQHSASYIDVLSQMFNKLGVPNANTKEILQAFEKENDNETELFTAITNSYLTTNNYFIQNEMDEYAAMIVLGGWVEGMYIATNIYKKNRNNQKLLVRIVEQRYSLRTIIRLLMLTKNEEKILDLQPHLTSLKKILNKIDVKYATNGVEIDSLRKVVIISNDVPQINATENQIDALINIVEVLHHKITQ